MYFALSLSLGRNQRVIAGSNPQIPNPFESVDKVWFQLFYNVPISNITNNLISGLSSTFI